MNNKETTIEQQLDRLFEFERQLDLLLDDQQFEQFQQQQVIFSSQLKRLLSSNTPATLNEVIGKLNLLNENIAALKKKAEKIFAQLKEQSLLHRRNKNRINAYK